MVLEWAPAPKKEGRRISIEFLRTRLWPLARWIVVLPIAYYLVLFLATSLGRIGYPFELEWFEGHLALQAERASRGLPQYPDPASGWVTFGYPPVYFWIVGFLYRLFGFGLLWGRIISLLSTIAAVLGAGMIIYDHTRKWLPAVAGGLLIFAYFKPCGFWFDLFRVDMTAQALLAWGAYLALKRCRKPWQLGVGLILLALAPLAKQTVFPVTVIVFLLTLLKNWRAARYLGVILLILAFDAVVFLQSPDSKTPPPGAKVPAAPAAQSADSWTWVYNYLVVNPQKHSFLWSRVHPEGVHPVDVGDRFLNNPWGFSKDYWKKFTARKPEVWGKLYVHLLFPLGLTAVWVLGSLAMRKRLRGGLWILFAIFLFYGSLTSWVMIGGFENNFIPIFSAAGILFGLAYGGILRLLPRRWMRAVFDVLILALLLYQFHPPLSLDPARLQGHPYAYAPSSQWPAAGSAKRGSELVRWIASQKDRVYIPHHVYLMRMAGKDLEYGIEAVRDLNYSGVPTPPSLIQRLNQGHYRYVLLDNELQWEWLPGEVKSIVQDKYQKAGPALPDFDGPEMLPVTGAFMKPRVLFEWKDAKSQNAPASQ